MNKKVFVIIVSSLMLLSLVSAGLVDDIKDLLGLSEKPSTSITYTPSTETICNGDVCNKIIYSGTQFVYEDENWKNISEAKSLKNSNIKCVVDSDGENIAECLDWNLTSIKLKISKKDSGESPVRVLKYNETKVEKAIAEEKIIKEEDKYSEKTRVDYSFDNSKEKDEKEIIVEAEFGDIIHFGETSTTIQLQDADTENLGDTYIRKSNPDSNYYTSTYLRTDASTSPYSPYRSYITFNLSQFNSSYQISSAVLALYKYTGAYENYISSRTVRAHHVYAPQDITTLTWNNQPCGSDFDNDTYCNLTYESEVSPTTTDGVWLTWSVLQMTNESIFDLSNLMIALKHKSETYETSAYMSYYSEDYTTDTSLRPYLNITYSLYGECTQSLVNTSWSDWIDTSACYINDTKTQNRSLIEYDENDCGTYENVTYWDFQEVSCDYCSYNVVNSSFGDWSNDGSCLIDDNQQQSRNLTEYDENYSTCYSVTGLESDLWNSGDNITFFEFQNISCDYCTPSALNTSWSNWFDTESCQLNDYLTQERNLTEYDDNFCYSITGLESDNFTNTTFYDYQESSCNYCSYNVANTSWSDWQNETECLLDGNQTQNRSLIEYDSNYSTCYDLTGLESDLWNSGDNITFFEFQNISCYADNCSPIIRTTINNGDSLSYYGGNILLQAYLNYTINESYFNYANYSVLYPNGSIFIQNISSSQSENISLNFTILGNYLWRIFANDTSGNTAIKIISFSFDLDDGAGGASLNKRYEENIIETNNSKSTTKVNFIEENKVTIGLISLLLFVLILGKKPNQKKKDKKK